MAYPTQRFALQDDTRNSKEGLVKFRILTNEMSGGTSKLRARNTRLCHMGQLRRGLDDKVGALGVVGRWNLH